MTPRAPETFDRCPLCSATTWVEDSVPEPNLYSEKLALLLGQDEGRLLDEHANWRCARCDLVFKRRWFPEDVIRQLFCGAVGMHPKGWDAILGRFSGDNFLCTVEKWARAVGASSVPDVRKGERELVSIVDSIAEPSDFDVAAVTAAIRQSDVLSVRAASRAIAASIKDPAPFKRFSGFRSLALWDYLQSKTGGFDAYAEVGCPLWGLLPLAAESGYEATYLDRQEVNYWGAGCTNAGESCSARLLRDPRIRAADWASPRYYPIIGVFQYLDHPTEPLRFLRELFGRANSAAVILDAMDSPVAIQHVTGWTEASLRYAAGLFDKHLYADFEDIRFSGNRLYLLSGSC